MSEDSLKRLADFLDELGTQLATPSTSSTGLSVNVVGGPGSGNVTGMSISVTGGPGSGPVTGLSIESKAYAPGAADLKLSEELHDAASAVRTKSADKSHVLSLLERLRGLSEIAVNAAVVEGARELAKSVLG